VPVIRFVRENRDVECYPGENLREVALREGIELYGFKGTLGNCGGCGQCITCFVEVVEGGPACSLSGRTAVEDLKLRRRPQTWRLACQALVQESLLVLTRPQLGLANQAAVVDEALGRPLPEGPTVWPQPPTVDASADPDPDDGEAVGVDGGLDRQQPPTATTGEGAA
jgi:ferredoxin